MNIKKLIPGILALMLVAGLLFTFSGSSVKQIEKQTEQSKKQEIAVDGLIKDIKFNSFQLETDGKVYEVGVDDNTKYQKRIVPKILSEAKSISREDIFFSDLKINDLALAIIEDNIATKVFITEAK